MLQFVYPEQRRSKKQLKKKRKLRPYKRGGQFRGTNIEKK